MKITSIKQQIKRKGRYSVFVEGKYSFSLGETALLESKIVNGQELDSKQIGDLKSKSAEDQTYGQALNYAMLRPHSTWEMQTYLKRKNCPPALQQTILNKLSNIDLINDENFARSWVAHRRLLKPTSLRKLQQELRAKRIEDDVITKVLSEGHSNDDLDALKQLIKNKRGQTRYHDKQKLMQYLASQGFGYGDIKQAISELDEDLS